MNIPFNFSTVVGNEEKYLLEALHSGKWSGRGPKTLALEKLAQSQCQVKHAFFVTSCSSALEVSCLAAGLKPGDEVILPSFGFVSAANAIVMTGAKPVFADIDIHTWNISVETVLPLINSKTKAILPVHYAGSSAHTDELREICKSKNLFLIEDAAQSLGSKRDGKPIGSTPWTTCFSLHDTKNVACGEGGFVMTDDDELAQKIEIMIEKGTNRQKFFRGQVDKYTWVERGSSYIASDLLAAVALGQMEKTAVITEKRIQIEKRFREALREFNGKIQWQKIPSNIVANGHIAAFVVPVQSRSQILFDFKEKGIAALFHYVPLHDAPYASEKGYMPKKDLLNSRKISEGLVRLPLFYSMTDEHVEYICQSAKEILKNNL
jgi:dTDP-4-amino-4,6-dideoxygalactose transaminase